MTFQLPPEAEAFIGKRWEPNQKEVGSRAGIGEETRHIQKARHVRPDALVHGEGVIHEVGCRCLIQRGGSPGGFVRKDLMEAHAVAPRHRRVVEGKQDGSDHEIQNQFDNQLDPDLARQ